MSKQTIRLANRRRTQTSFPPTGETMKTYPRKLAIIDGCGSTAMVYLYNCRDDENYDESPWPKHWPSWVSTEFLKSQGFDVEAA